MKKESSYKAWGNPTEQISSNDISREFRITIDYLLSETARYVKQPGHPTMEYPIKVSGHAQNQGVTVREEGIDRFLPSFYSKQHFIDSLYDAHSTVAERGQHVNWRTASYLEDAWDLLEYLRFHPIPCVRIGERSKSAASLWQVLENFDRGMLEATDVLLKSAYQGGLLGPLYVQLRQDNEHGKMIEFDWGVFYQYPKTPLGLNDVQGLLVQYGCNSRELTWMFIEQLEKRKYTYAQNTAKELRILDLITFPNEDLDTLSDKVKQEFTYQTKSARRANAPFWKSWKRPFSK